MGLKLNGATSGSIEIDVPAVAGTDTAITIPATTGGEFIVSDSSGNIDLGPLDINGSASDDSVNIDSSGRLLVGTSTAQGNNLLQLEGSASGAGEWSGISLRRGVATASLTSGQYLGAISFQSQGGAEGGVVRAICDANWSASSHPTRLTFETTASSSTSPTERMRIASNGRLRVNLADFGNDVGTSNKGFEVNEDGIILTSQPSTATQSHHLFYNPNGNVGSIQTNGSSTYFNTSSDYRLKENVVPIADGITRLQQLNPARFNFIADPNKTVDGFLAHEVQDVVPEAISGEKDAVDDEGNFIYQAIDQSKLVPLLTAALQEAIGKIETLETANASQAAAIAALDARLTALEGGAA